MGLEDCASPNRVRLSYTLAYCIRAFSNYACNKRVLRLTWLYRGLAANHQLIPGLIRYAAIITGHLHRAALFVFTLMRCLPKESHLTLLLGGDYNEFLVHSHNNMIPVALIDETHLRFDILRKFILSRYSDLMFMNYNFMNFPRAHRSVLVTSSQPLLRALLQTAKDSPYANLEGFYILVDKQTETRGCINARSYLWTAWEYGLLSVIFICIDPDDGIVLYTFNPYSNRQLVRSRTYQRASGSSLDNTEEEIHTCDICIDLDFDKTITLNRYQIRLSTIEMEPYVKINLSLPKQERFRGVSSDIIKMLLNKMNVFTLMRCLPTESHLTLLLGGDYNEFLVHSHNNMIPVVLIDETNPRFDALQKFALSRYSDLTFENNNFMHFPRAHRFVLVTSSQPLLRALLQDAGYTLYGLKYFHNPTNDPVIDFMVKYEDCIEHVKNSSTAACLDNDVCIDLDFDKTTTLNGYPIRLNAIEMEPFVKINLSLSKQERLRGKNSDIIRMLLNKLNARREITVLHRDVFSLGHIGSNDTYDSLTTFVSDRRIDITMNTRLIFEWWKIKYVSQ
ncbi:hypothetical protein EAG_14157 [Camponotus floridanus]|uniref:Uncharacterized protein n=1 Tax=Camponotus floridanus TaxID=104421 RepID=E2A5V6_CAMFO|nr:hypothetical protein EAG_14157 [Camponotus floridanus]